MEIPQHRHRSHLFTVRLWLEDLSDGRTEWRGEVHSIETGETCYFRDWPSLIQLLLALPRREDANGHPGGPDSAPPRENDV